MIEAMPRASVQLESTSASSRRVAQEPLGTAPAVPPSGIEQEVRRLFTTPQSFTRHGWQTQVIDVVPLFDVEAIAEDPSLQHVLVALTVELADLLMQRDKFLREGRITPFQHLQCDTFRATRLIHAWTILARDVLSREGVFGDAITTYEEMDARSNEPEEGPFLPHRSLLHIVVWTAFAAREKLSGVRRGLGDVPKVYTDSEAATTLAGQLWRWRELQGPDTYREIRLFVGGICSYDRLAPATVVQQMLGRMPAR